MKTIAAFNTFFTSHLHGGNRRPGFAPRSLGKGGRETTQKASVSTNKNGKTEGFSRKVECLNFYKRHHFNMKEFFGRNTSLFSFFAVAMLSIHCPITAQADSSTKIATIDINAVLNGLPEARARRKEFQSKRDDAQKKLEDQKTVLVEQEKKLKAAKASPQSPEVDKFRVAAKKFEETVNSTEENLKTDFMKANREFTDRVMGAVEKYARSQKIDLVIEKQAKGRSAVLYGEPSMDITEAILKTLEK